LFLLRTIIVVIVVIAVLVAQP